MGSSDTSSDHFRRCWRQQYCPSCLDQPSCSWCPFTQACVPNTASIPLLAPAYDEQICPHWSERWELRTRPLGCQVSSITALSVLVAVASTLAVVGFIRVGVVVWRHGRRKIRTRNWGDQWRAWRARRSERERGARWVFGRNSNGDRGGRGDRVVGGGGAGEEEPLLGSAS
ncbi:hypothetical protein VTI28DRAFT_6355 [Corynascus sepedonium]